MRSWKTISVLIFSFAIVLFYLVDSDPKPVEIPEAKKSDQNSELTSSTRNGILENEDKSISPPSDRFGDDGTEKPTTPEQPINNDPARGEREKAASIEQQHIDGNFQNAESLAELEVVKTVDWRKAEDLIVEELSRGKYSLLEKLVIKDFHKVVGSAQHSRGNENSAIENFQGIFEGQIRTEVEKYRDVEIFLEINYLGEDPLEVAVNIELTKPDLGVISSSSGSSSGLLKHVQKIDESDKSVLVEIDPKTFLHLFQNNNGTRYAGNLYHLEQESSKFLGYVVLERL